MTFWRLHIPDWRPPSLNEHAGKHWSYKHGLKKEALWRIHGARKQSGGVPDAISKRDISVTVFLGKGERAFDEDNSWKVLLDTLVTLRLLRDDSRKWLGEKRISYDRHPDRHKETILELIEAA